MPDFFLLCPLSFFKPMSIRELRRSPAVSSTWSLVVNIYLMGRHVSCMLDQSVTLIRSFSSPVWTFSTFSSFIKTYYLVLLKLALVCACMTISIAGHSGAKSGKVFSARYLISTIHDVLCTYTRNIGTKNFSDFRTRV